MHIALTGASGFIGSEIAKDAFNHGHTVTALVRETSNRHHIESSVENFIVGKHNDPKAIAALLDGADAVIHNSFDWGALKSGDLDCHIKTNLQGSIDLLEASDDRHFIYISSIAVHHHMHPNRNGQIDESHPTRPGGLYGACKASVEAHMWASHSSRGQCVTAIRPTAVYGIDPNIERSIGFPIIQTLQQGNPYTKLGGGKFGREWGITTGPIETARTPTAESCLGKYCGDLTRIVCNDLAGSLGASLALLAVSADVGIPEAQEC